MKAEITPLEIPLNSSITSQHLTKFNKSNSRITLVFIIFFFLNVFALMDIGAIITSEQSNYFYCLYPLSFIGNLLYSIFSVNLIHKISTKRNIIITLIIMILFLLLTIITKKYLTHLEYSTYIILISKVIISLMQASLSIISIQWCQHFSTEHSRLCIIETLQLTPLIGIVIGYISELGYSNLSFYIQIPAVFLILIILIFIPFNLLENVTKHLTNAFLRHSLASTNDELKSYTLLILLQNCVSVLGLFIFSVIFFHKTNQLKLESKIEKAFAFSSMSILEPFLGLAIGGYTLALLNWRKSIWIILTFSIVGFGLNILFYLVSKDALIKNVYLGVMLMFYMSLLPLVYSSISKMIIDKETRGWIITIMVSSNNLIGLGCGGYFGGYFHDILDTLLFYLSIAFFFFFVLFFIVYVCKLHNDTLQPAEFFKYQLFLLISFAFGKFSLFIWDDYLGESIVKLNNQSFSAQINQNVDVLYNSHALPNYNLIQEDFEANEEHNTVSNSRTSDNNRPSQMTFDQHLTTRITIDNNIKEDFIFDANVNIKDGFSFKHKIFDDEQNN